MTNQEKALALLNKAQDMLDQARANQRQVEALIARSGELAAEAKRLLNL